MNTDPHLLCAFVEVARSSSFGSAATALHLDPSTVSRQVAQLERRIGVRLFERTTRQVWLTDAGRALLPEAVVAIESLQSFGRAAAAVDRQVRGEVVLGFQAHAINTEMLGWVSEAEAETGVSVRLHEGNFSDPSTGLRSRTTDLAFVFTPFDSSGLEVVTIVELPWLAFLPATHRLAGRESVELSELFDETWIRPDCDDELYLNHWQANDLRGDRPAPEAPAYATPEASLALIATGRAIGVGATVRGPLKLEGVVAVPVVDEREANVALAWTRDGLTPQIEGFRDALLERASQAASPP
jgi:DNA-binding transcriptional LysR family regulator